ncbi:MAG: glycosyltransferase, partial [Clostridiales bacterium]|nr:glycosyltransferase [Clostridiales bacterium]
MTEKADISVIIPVYNGEKYLGECLESITKQTAFDRLEVITVDDGSTDKTPEICGAYSEKYKNIRVIRTKNSGVSAARNRGIAEASGEFIAFVDSDDRLYPEMYERLITAARKTNADIAVCGYLYQYPDRDVTIDFPFMKDCFL